MDSPPYPIYTDLTIPNDRSSMLILQKILWLVIILGILIGSGIIIFFISTKKSVNY